MYLLLIFSSVSVKAQDITLEEYSKILKSQSSVCRYIITGELSVYCFFHIEAKYFEQTEPPCVTSPADLGIEEIQALEGRMSLACPTPPNLALDYEKLTSSERKALMTPVVRCIQPILSSASEEYDCHSFDYSQIFEQIIKKWEEEIKGLKD